YNPGATRYPDGHLLNAGSNAVYTAFALFLSERSLGVGAPLGLRLRVRLVLRLRGGSGLFLSVRLGDDLLEVRLLRRSVVLGALGGDHRLELLLGRQLAAFGN